MTDSYSIRKSNKKTYTGRIAFPKDRALLLCLSILLYVYFIGFFTFNFGIPETAYYITDALLIICLMMSIKRVRRAFSSKRIKHFSALLASLVIIGTGSALLNGFKPLLWLWSLRNWGRLFAYLYLCCALLNEKWIDKMLKMTLNVFYINVFVIVIQFFVIKGYGQDQLNGLVGRSVSGASIILSMAATTIVSAEYVSKKCRIKKLNFTFVCVLLVSVLAELKANIFFAFLIFGVILLANSKLTFKILIRNILFAVAAMAALIIGLKALARVYPEFGKILSIDWLLGAISNEKGYGNSGYIDRLTAVKVVNRDFFSNDITKQFFGIGMGNAEYSTMASLTSSFYNLYGLLYSYLGFSVAMLYIEGGYIGLGIYIVMFIVLLINTIKRINHRKRTNDGKTDCYYESIGLGMTLLGWIFIWYNNLLRTDMAVLIAFYMAIPFAVSKVSKSSIWRLINV